MYDYLIVGAGLFGSVFANEIYNMSFNMNTFNKMWGSNYTS